MVLHINVQLANTSIFLVVKSQNKSNNRGDRMPKQKYHGTKSDHKELRGRKVHGNICLFEQSGPPEKTHSFNEY